MLKLSVSTMLSRSYYLNMSNSHAGRHLGCEQHTGGGHDLECEQHDDEGHYNDIEQVTMTLCESTKEVNSLAPRKVWQ